MAPAQEQQFDTSQGNKEQHKLSPWMRWIIIILVLLSIGAGTIVWIVNGQEPGASIIYIIFTALGLIFSFFQVFALGKPHHSSVTSPPLPQTSPFSTNRAPAEVIVAPLSQGSPIIPLHEPNSNEPILTHNNRHQEDWGEAPHLRQLYGRKQELAELKQWIIDDRHQLITLLGMGGIGKTSLAAMEAEQIKDQFTYIFWRSLQNAPPLENILEKCIPFFSNQQHTLLPKELDDQFELLLECLRKQRCLLVLDNLETLLQSGVHAGQFRNNYEGYDRLIQLAGEIQHQSCLLLTSREKPLAVANLEGRASPVRSLPLLGIRQQEAQELLQDKGLFGSDEAWSTLTRFYSGNPLALKLVAESIGEVFGRDVDAFMKEGETVVSNVYKLLAQQFQRLSVLEQDIMYWLAIEREVVSLDTLREELARPVTNRELLGALESLRHRSLLETSIPASFTLQPVIMEFVVSNFVERVTEEIVSESIEILASHALMKAQAKDYIRESQVRLILVPVAEQLLASRGEEGTKQKLKRILSTLHQTHPHSPRYAAGNILNLLVQLHVDLQEFDFSQQTIWQAYLQGITLSNVNFAHAHFKNSVFTNTFGSIYSVAWSPNGERLAAGTSTGEIRIWHVTSGKPLLLYQGHRGIVYSLAFSPDGGLLASSSSDVRIWEVNTGHCLRILQGHTDPIIEIAFSPDGTRLASGSLDQSIRLWDLNTGDCIHILQGHTHWVYTVIFSPDKTILASGSYDQSIRLWDVSTGDCLHILRGHTGGIESIAFNSEGTLLASAGQDDIVRIWEVSTSNHLGTLQGHTEAICSIAFSPDGTRLASGSLDRTVRIWEVNSGFCLRILQGHTNQIMSVAFHPKGQILATGDTDQNVQLWDVNTGDCLQTLPGHTHWVYAVTFSPDGTLLVSGSIDRTIRVWDVSTGHCLYILQGHTYDVRSVAFSPDGSLLASGSSDGTICIWEVNSGHCLYTLQGHTNRVYSVAFSPISNATLLASGSEDGTVRLWNASTGHCFHILQGHTYGVWSVAFSPDGSLLVSSSEDQTVRYWEPKTGDCIYIMEYTDKIASVAFSPNKVTLASGSLDGTIHLWNVQTYECLRTMRSDRPYERMDITKVSGLTAAEKNMLKMLGAIENEN